MGVRTMCVLLVAGLWAGNAVAKDPPPGWFDEPPEPGTPVEPASAEPPDPPPAPPGPYSAAAADVPLDAEPPDQDLTLSEEEDQVDPQRQQEALQRFNPVLSTYGNWVVEPTYGRVWVPSPAYVGAEFSPYVTRGRWALSDTDDWVWVSDYPFGWVTFHYGRWVWTSSGYWGWVPGYVYAPAWVEFRVGPGGYLGWGPLPPRRLWRGGLFVGWGYYPARSFVYCSTNYLFHASLSHYIIRDRLRARRIARRMRRYRRVRRRDGRRYYAGPSPRTVGIQRRSLPRERVRLAEARRWQEPRRARIKPGPRVRERHVRERDAQRGRPQPTKWSYREDPRYRSRGEQRSSRKARAQDGRVPAKRIQRYSTSRSSTSRSTSARPQPSRDRGDRMTERRVERRESRSQQGRPRAERRQQTRPKPRQRSRTKERRSRTKERRSRPAPKRRTQSKQRRSRPAPKRRSRPAPKRRSPPAPKQRSRAKPKQQRRAQPVRKQRRRVHRASPERSRSTRTRRRSD